MVKLWHWVDKYNMVHTQSTYCLQFAHGPFKVLKLEQINLSCLCYAVLPGTYSLGQLAIWPLRRLVWSPAPCVGHVPTVCVCQPSINSVCKSCDNSALTAHQLFIWYVSIFHQPCIECWSALCRISSYDVTLFHRM